MSKRAQNLFVGCAVSKENEPSLASLGTWEIRHLSASLFHLRIHDKTELENLIRQKKEKEKFLAQIIVQKIIAYKHLFYA